MKSDILEKVEREVVLTATHFDSKETIARRRETEEPRKQTDDISRHPKHFILIKKYRYGNKFNLSKILVVSLQILISEKRIYSLKFFTRRTIFFVCFFPAFVLCAFLIRFCELFFHFFSSSDRDLYSLEKDVENGNDETKNLFFNKSSRYLFLFISVFLSIFSFYEFSTRGRTHTSNAIPPEIKRPRGLTVAFFFSL